MKMKTPILLSWSRAACAWSVPVLAVVLAVAGCRENQTIDPNNSPLALAEVDGEKATEAGDYEVDLSGDTVELTLDASDSTDLDGEVVEYIWMSGTIDPSGAPGRFIPSDEDEDWPKDGRKTDVELGEGFWTFHLYVKDDEGAVSLPFTLDIKVGDPPPLPSAGSATGASSGDGGDGASADECVGIAAEVTMSDECAECACGQPDCAGPVAECDAACWGLIACVAAECAGDASDVACITSACVAFLGGVSTATAAGGCAAACAAECAM